MAEEIIVWLKPTTLKLYYPLAKANGNGLATKFLTQLDYKLRGTGCLIPNYFFNSNEFIRAKGNEVNSGGKGF